jgi:spore maturation protein A
MINYVWYFLIGSGIVTAMLTGGMNKVTEAIFQSAIMSIDLAIKLLGPMILWSGLMKIAEESNLTNLIARLIKPVFHRIFPQIPPGDPAAGTILMNLSANLLGIGNSATPLGIKAMQDLQRLNPDQNKASPAMCTLLAINTSSLTLIPATMISLRAATGSVAPGIIIISTIFATTISTITAIVLDKTARMFSGA